MTPFDVTVVVCAKNEQARLCACLDSLQGQGAAEVIVIDGNSADLTAIVAATHGARVYVSNSGSLPVDRQFGADLALTPLVAFIDADHRLEVGDLARMVDDLERTGFDVCQSGLRIAGDSWWNRAESEFLDLTHNVPGEKHMVGVAPTIFRGEVLDTVRFAIEGSIDDTDYFYRLHRDTDYRMGIGSLTIAQAHEGSWKSYRRKFAWYGAGDGQFCRTHPERRASMWFHLLIRYPLVYPWRALAARKPRAAIYAVAQGLVRFRALISS